MIIQCPCCLTPTVGTKPEYTGETVSDDGDHSWWSVCETCRTRVTVVTSWGFDEWSNETQRTEQRVEKTRLGEVIEELRAAKARIQQLEREEHDLAAQHAGGRAIVVEQ
jgi:hypothetical protein